MSKRLPAQYWENRAKAYKPPLNQQEFDVFWMMAYNAVKFGGIALLILLAFFITGQVFAYFS